MISSRRIDIMVDIETLGTSHNATIFQIGAVVFDLKTGEYQETYSETANISLSRAEDLMIDGDTIKWWTNNHPKMFSKLLNDAHDVTVDQLIENFHAWLMDFVEGFNKENVYLWGNGSIFDNLMLKVQMEKLDLEYPIFYKNDRDIRTLLEVASEKSGISEYDIKKQAVKSKDGTQHDAILDCYDQIDYTSECWKILTNKS